MPNATATDSARLRVMMRVHMLFTHGSKDECLANYSAIRANLRSH